MAGCFIASVTTANITTACHSRHRVTAHFQQGVASGDPGPGSVVLWTRSEPVEGNLEVVEVKLEVALDEEFTETFYQNTYTVSYESDYTLRVLLEGLDSNKFYFFRFISGENQSITGRTRTAPDPLDMQPVKLAFMSCQERKHGFYNAYRRLLIDDLNAPKNEQIHFVLHLGDFIYETRNDPLQNPVDDLQQPLNHDLLDNDGTTRSIDPFIDGSVTSDGIQFAETLDDYRQLYKQYLKDQDLQAARARWPFIPVWDDHEFSDDCWQTEANYENTGVDSSTNEPSQPRKVAANQAWFEYMPVNLTQPETTDNDLHHSHDFTFTDVTTSANTLINEQNQVINEDNVIAINSLTIYRNFQYGALLQLVLTDNRSYRSDHAIPEDITGNIDLFISPRVALPLELQNELDAGKTANNGEPDSFLFLGGLVLNPRRFSPPGTMLGSNQKDWLKQTFLRSNTHWKIWANSVPLMRFMFNLSALDTNLGDLLLSVDTWDGYRTERNEIMKFLVANNINNVVSLSGDLHAHFAGEVWTDFDGDMNNNQVAMVEAVCSGISSISQFSAVEKLSRREQPTATETLVRQLISYDSRLSTNPGDNPFVTNLNNTLLNGVKSAQVAADTNDLSKIENSKNPAVNPHLVYADTHSQGYGIAFIEAEQMTIELVSINSINKKNVEAIQKKRVAKFVIPHIQAGQIPVISEPVITGSAPFPFDNK